MKTTLNPTQEQEMRIPAGEAVLRGDLVIPPEAIGMVLFAHGSGSGRKSSRNRFVARMLQEKRIATLLFDLLTEREEVEDSYSAHSRFDIPLLAGRLEAVTRWSMMKLPELRAGFFGASTGAAAALIAAARLGAGVAAVVSRGGRPDLAGPDLRRVTAPTLLIVGGLDFPVIDLNEKAFEQLQCRKEMRIIPGATHLFEEPGTLENAARDAAEWFEAHFDQRGS